MDDSYLALLILLYILFFITMIYYCILADPTQNRTAKFLSTDLPSHLTSTLVKFTPTRITTLSRRASDTFLKEVFYKANPALQILYLCLVLGSWSIMFFYGYEYIPNKYMSSWHRTSGYLLFLLCMGSFKLASTSNPGFITAANLPRYDHFPYDNLLYAPNRICPTTHFRKLARSKYDRMTNRHVAKFDHYCAWINNPVGEENYRYFLLFLCIHVLMCSYGTWAVLCMAVSHVQELDLYHAAFYNLETQLPVQVTHGVVVHYLTMTHPQLACVGLLMSVMAVVLWGFVMFHGYLILKGLTTNEYFKWKGIKKYHEQCMKEWKKANKEGRGGEVNEESTLVAVAETWVPPQDRKRDGGGGGEQQQEEEEKQAEETTTVQTQSRKEQQTPDETATTTTTTTTTKTATTTTTTTTTTTITTRSISSHNQRYGVGGALRQEEDTFHDAMLSEIQQDVDVGCIGPSSSAAAASSYSSNPLVQPTSTALSSHDVLPMPHPPPTPPPAASTPTSTSTTKTTTTTTTTRQLVQHPGPLPTHLYDRGLVENIREVIWPLSKRPSQDRVWVDSRDGLRGLVGSRKEE